MNSPTPLQVVGAAILRADIGPWSDREILCGLRKPGGNIGGMWEFPGGKVEPGEPQRSALIRECLEELLVDVEVGMMIASTTMAYPGGVFTLETYYCRLTRGTPTLTEHDELRWVKVSELRDLNWAPGDLEAVSRIESHDGTSVFPE
jgi:8-oxo-dGTP diphosphatase